MKNWLKKCSVALLVFSMIGTTMPVYAWMRQSQKHRRQQRTRQKSRSLKYRQKNHR